MNENIIQVTENHFDIHSSKVKKQLSPQKLPLISPCSPTLPSNPTTIQEFSFTTVLSFGKCTMHNFIPERTKIHQVVSPVNCSFHLHYPQPSTC